MLNIHNSNIQNDLNLNNTKTKQKNFQNKSNSESYFNLSTKFQKRITKNKDKKHHKYCESKSTK